MKYELKLGDNAETLKQYPDNHFDSIVTDPPYGIEFLGKDWDKNTGVMETWHECFRVLKPGGHILAFSAARTYHNLATNIESAGFEIRDQLMWLYGSGFPKAQDIGKAIDKRANKKDPNYSGTNFQVITSTEGVKKSSMKCGKCNKRSRNRTRDCKEKDCGLDYNYQTEEAKQWAGWKTALKPAHEPVVMARKPFKGSCLDNVLKHGVGAMNIDESRIGDEIRTTVRRADGKEKLTFGGECANSGVEYEKIDYQGRYPSNVIGEIPDYQQYFYCPKVSRKERHIGFEQGNNHPTVKPVELMKYLVKLVTPKGGKVLDPFSGSGSTGMACVELDYEYTGCELDPEYIEIATKRIEGWYEHTRPDNNFDELF